MRASPSRLSCCGQPREATRDLRNVSHFRALSGRRRLRLPPSSTGREAGDPARLAAISTSGIAEGGMELKELQHSSRVRARYFKALELLLDQLNETWKRIFPPAARIPRESSDAFFEPFAQFGVALYDAYAEELLDSKQSQEQYLQSL